MMKSEVEPLHALIPLLYLEQRRQIRNALRNHEQINPSELYGRLFLHLVESQQIGIEDRPQFRAISAQLLRRILVGLARKQVKTGKRESRKELVIDSSALPEILRLENDVREFGKNDGQLEQVFVMRFYGKLSFAEIGRLLEIHPSIAESKWNHLSEKLWPVNLQ